MSSRATVLASALLLATSLQCHGRNAAQGDDAKSNAPGKPFVAGKDDAPLAPVARAQELLPPDTQLLFEGKSMARAAEVFNRDKIEKEQPKIYGDIAKQIQQVFGVDILVPANLPAIGVDPNGPVGIALLDADREAFAVWAKLTDPGKFREVVIAAAARSSTQLAPVSLGGAEILRDQNGQGAVVLREPFAVLVMSRPPREGQENVDWARAIGTMDPSQSLASSPEFRKATAGWVDTDAIAYGNMASLVSSLLRVEESEMAMINNNWAQEELENARKRGATAEEIARLEAQAKQVRDDNKRWEERRKAERELARFILGGMSTLAMRVDVKRSGPVIEGRVQQGADAFPRSLVRNGEDAPALTSALDGRPVMLVAGNLEVEAFVDLVDRVARAEGESWKTIVDKLQKQTGVDVDAEIRPQLTGVAGFAATIDGDASKATPQTIQKLFGVHAHVEVNDPARVEAALAKALPKLEIDGRTFKKDKDGGWSMEVEKFRKLHVKVAGKHVVLSTDPALAGRIAAGKAGSIDKRVKPTAAYGAMSMKGQAFTYAQDFGAFASFFLLGRSSSMPVTTTGKPKSRTARAKQAELAKVNKQIAKQQDVVDAAEMNKMFSTADPFGTTVIVAREENDGFVLQGGQFIRAKDLGDLVLKMMTAFSSGFEQTPERAKLNDLFNRRFKLEEELRQLEVTDAPKPGKRR
jgi:hypothetical protein